MDPSYKKDAAAGFIGYTADGLDVMGSGQTASGRKIKFWADAGSSFNGDVSTDKDLLVKGSATVNANMTVGNQVTTNALAARSANITALVANSSVDMNGTTNINGPFNIKTPVTAFGDVKNQNKWAINVAPADNKMQLGLLGADGKPAQTLFNFGSDASFTSGGNITAPTASITTVNSDTVNVNGKLNINNDATSIGVVSGNVSNKWIMHTPKTDTQRKLLFAPQNADGPDWDKQFAFFPNGDLSIKGVVKANDVASSSDSRLKSNVQKIKGALDKLKHINGYTFDKEGAPSRSTGVIAQEVEAIVPELVKDQDGVKSVRYDRFGVLLIPIVKQLSERLEVVEKENADLKRRLERLEGLLLKVE
jgi:cytoskeletal protein CcmA (bactofilin family)